MIIWGQVGGRSSQCSPRPHPPPPGVSGRPPLWNCLLRFTPSLFERQKNFQKILKIRGEKFPEILEGGLDLGQVEAAALPLAASAFLPGMRTTQVRHSCRGRIVALGNGGRAPRWELSLLPTQKGNFAGPLPGLATPWRRLGWFYQPKQQIRPVTAVCTKPVPAPGIPTGFLIHPISLQTDVCGSLLGAPQPGPRQGLQRR